MILKVKCNKCGHSMKYQPLKQLTGKSKKQCVYCGYSITVKNQILGPARP